MHHYRDLSVGDIFYLSIFNKQVYYINVGVCLEINSKECVLYVKSYVEGCETDSYRTIISFDDYYFEYLYKNNYTSIEIVGTI